MIRILTAAVLSTAVLLPAAYADSQRSAATRAAQASEPLSEGEVRKVDKEAKKITIKHGPLANLDMPAMTMVFQVKDPGMLEQAKAGDKVQFRAEKEGGAFVLIELKAVK